MFSRYIRGRWRSNLLIALVFTTMALYFYNQQKYSLNKNINDAQTLSVDKFNTHKVVQHIFKPISSDVKDSQKYENSQIKESREKEVQVQNSDGIKVCKSLDGVISQHDLLTSDLWRKAWSKSLPIVQNNDHRQIQGENSTEPDLNVFIILHSHVDPGWLKKFDEYFKDEVVSILNNMLQFMSEHKDIKYIWSEISFLEKWWWTLDDQRKQQLKNLLDTGQLELTGGPWVMTDEATTHHWATVDNIIEGHDFLHTVLHNTPNVSWTVDPFGHGGTVPYLMSLSGVKHHVIGRLYAEFKTWFRESNNLLVTWRQLWDKSGANDVFTQMLPYFTYVTPDNCGPERQKCTKYDFGPSARFRQGTVSRLEDRAMILEYATDLASNYRKLSKYYRDPIIMVPHGDDFGMKTSKDWHDVYDSYTAMFPHMQDLGVKVQFGTLSDYFNALNEHRRSTKAADLPILSGDFFPYVSGGNNKDHWTGFYSTRPFYKRRERELESYLRSADVLVQTSLSKVTSSNKIDLANWMCESLKQARRDLALFQHHDAITGTSRQVVMDDYAKRMILAWQSISLVQSVAISILMGEKPPDWSQESLLKIATNYNQTIFVETALDKLQDLRIEINPEFQKLLVIENSLPQYRNVVQRLIVANTQITIAQAGKSMTFQINPIISKGRIASDKFEIVFIAALAPLSISTYELKYSKDLNLDKMAKLYTQNSQVFKTDDSKTAFVIEEVPTFELKNEHGISCKFNPNGFMQTLTIDDKEHNISHRMYAMESNSGAYLIYFNKQQDKSPTVNDFNYSGGKPIVVWKVEGPIISHINLDSEKLRLKYTLVNSPDPEHGGIHVKLSPKLDSTDRKGIELISSFKTDIQSSTSSSNKQIYTDTNCLQLSRRDIIDSVPLSANFYPVSCAAILQSDKYRLTTLTGQPHAVTSLWVGSLDIVVDRLAYRNEGLGLPEGVNTSPSADQVFFITLATNKHINHENAQIHKSNELEYLDLGTHLAQQSLINPPVGFIAMENAEGDAPSHIGWPERSLTPCDVTLLSCRLVNNGSQTLISVRRSVNTCQMSHTHTSYDSCSIDGQQTFVNALFAYLKYDITNARETSLTGTHNISTSVNVTSLELQVNQIRTFKVNNS